MDRLSEMVETLLPAVTTQLSGNIPSHKGILDGILIRKLDSQVALLKFLTRDLEALLKMKPNIKTVIIDSIAYLFRYQEVGREHTFGDQTEALLSIIQSLRKIARDHKVLVVVVNQVTEDPFFQKQVPSLGKLWRGACSKRIFLEKDISEPGLRRATLLKSFSPCEPILYRITVSTILSFIRGCISYKICDYLYILTTQENGLNEIEQPNSQ